MIDISQFEQTRVVLKDRKYLLAFACREIHQEGDVLEFGVFRGNSLKQISDHFRGESRTVFGFDSFEGLPEDWWMNEEEKESGVCSHPSGHFSDWQTIFKKNFPTIPKNVQLVKGFFEDTLPEFIEKERCTKIAMIHIDGDLYSSAKTVLFELNHMIEPGCLILFDELAPFEESYPYDLWEEGEWRALKEWVQVFDRKFEVLARSRKQQALIRVL